MDVGWNDGRYKDMPSRGPVIDKAMTIAMGIRNAAFHGDFHGIAIALL